MFYSGKKIEVGKYIVIGSIYNVLNCKYFIGNGCEESSFNFLRFFYCLLKIGCRNFIDLFGVYIYCFNFFIVLDLFSIVFFRELIFYFLYLCFKDMMLVFVVG